MPSLFTFPNRILFGEGAVADLPSELKRAGISRPLIVTDSGLVASGIVNQVVKPIGPATLFDKVHANPTEEDVLGGLDHYRTEGCDGIVGLGGGSPIDAAKAIRLLVTHPGRLLDYDFTTGGLAKITADLPPMFAIPTTAGTGTEAGRGTLIQLPQNGRKTIALSPHLLPSLAICDPLLLVGLPPILTAGTGLDAFTHCVESYLSTTFHPICDGIALEGLKHLSRGLESSVLDGQNIRARRECMLGALLGGISFHKGLGVIHSLSHALGSEGRAHHGTLNAILLPHAIRFNREAAEARLVEIAATLGLGRSGDGTGHLLALVDLLLGRMPLPRRLGLIEGLQRDRIPEYARLAMLDHCHVTNPRPCTLVDLEVLLDRAW
jgi:4-hydroxybutyrate dehydrogenase